MVIVHVATCWMSLTMVTCKSIEMVKLTVTVFIYHETETLRNEFSNHNTVSLAGKARVSRALFPGETTIKWRTFVRKFVAPLKFVSTLKESSLLLTYMHAHWQFSKTTNLNGANPQIVPPSHRPSPNFLGEGRAFNPQIINIWLYTSRSLNTEKGGTVFANTLRGLVL